MMTILRFLHGRLRLLLLVSAIASVLSGLSRAGLIKLLNDALTHRHFSISLYIALCLAGPLCSMLAELCGVHAINELMHEVLLTLARQILQLPLGEVEKAGNHKIYSALTEDAYLITGSLKLFPNIVVQSSMIFGCSAYLAYLSMKAFACLVAIFIVSIITFRLSHKFGRKYMRRARQCTDNIVRHIQYLTGNFKELQLHYLTRERYLEDGLSRAADAYRRPILIGSAVYSLNANANHIMFFAMMGVMLYMGPRWLSLSKPGLETGYGLALLFLIGPITTLTTLLSSAGAIGAAFKHIEDLGLDLTRGGSDPPGRPDPITDWHVIRLENVTHTYSTAGSDDSFSVGPLNLELTPGQIVFIIGGNGSGKTTAAKLCCGLYPAATGCISLDGHVITDQKLAPYRELFSVVFSDIFLFEKLFGLPRESSQTDVDYLLHRFDLHHKVTLNDGWLSTIALSRGQQKRVALVLAYMENRPIYIFDEWAADQDPGFRKTFYREILPELRRRGKCVIVVSHDDSYFDVADRIIKMEHGKVAASTANESLLVVSTPISSNHHADGASL